MVVATKPSVLVTVDASPIEKCSFVCHLLILPLGLAYIVWVVAGDETLQDWNISYYPPREWSVYMPISAFLLFIATPILYAGLNSTTVPCLDSMDTLKDDYTRTPSSSETSFLAQQLAPEATLPDICDLDPSSLVWYPRDETRRGKAD